MDKFKEFLKGRGRFRSRRDERAAGFRNIAGEAKGEDVEVVERHSPVGQANPAVREMFSFINGLFNSEGEANTTVYRKGDNVIEINKYIINQVEMSKRIFKEQATKLYSLINQIATKKIPRYHSYGNQAEFEFALAKSFWGGYLNFLKVEYGTEVERVTRPPAKILKLGGRRTIREAPPTLQVVRQETLNNRFQQDPKIGEALSINLGLHNFAAISLKWYATDFFKTFKRNLEIVLHEAKEDEKISLDTIFANSERVYGHGSGAVDEFRQPPFSLDLKTVTYYLNTLPLRARESFNKWAELKEKKLSDEGESVVEFYSNRDWSISPVFIRNLIMRHPRTAEYGFRIVDAVIDEVGQEFPHIPRAVIIDTIVNNPMKSEKEDPEDPNEHNGYIDDLREIVKKSEFIISTVKNEEIFFRGTKSRLSDDLFRVLQLEKFIYNQVSYRKGGFDISFVLKVVNIVKKELGKDENKNLTSLSAKRRILSKLLRLSSAVFDTNEGRTKIDRFLARLSRGEQRRKAAQESMANKYFKDAEELDLVWGSYYVLFGFSEIEEDDEGRRRDYLSNGKLVVDMIIEEMQKKLGEDSTEQAASFFDNMMDIFVQYLSDERFIGSGIKESDTSFAEFKMALILEPRDPRSYYEKIRATRGNAMLPWPVNLPIKSSEVSWED